MTAPGTDDPGIIKITLSGIAKPYRERQRAFQTGAHGRPITYSYRPASLRTYQQWVRQAAMQAMGDRPPLTGPVSMTLRVFVAAPKSLRKREKALAQEELLWCCKRPDSVQYLKGVEDGCVGVVIPDDAQIAEHHLSRRYSMRPRIELEFRSLANGGTTQ